MLHINQIKVHMREPGQYISVSRVSLSDDGGIFGGRHD